MKTTLDLEDSYPLSPMQEGMLFHSLYASRTGVDIEQMVWTLHEALDFLAFEKAWQRVIDRHPVLRSAFRWQDQSKPIQEVHRCVKVAVAEHDWRNLPPGDCEAHLKSYLEEDRREGFDLSKPALLRLALFHISQNEYRFVWTFHHILLDGRSFPILIKEVFAFYDAIQRGGALELEQPRPYRDHIAFLQKQDFSMAEQFWRKFLDGFSMSTPLVVDQTLPKASALEFEHGTRKMALSSMITDALQKLARQESITLNTFVQGAWALLLHRYSGEEDIVFGATRACRSSSVVGAGNMVGLFINTLPVRVRVAPGTQIVPWLKKLREQQVAVRDSEHTPLVNIHGWSKVPRSQSLFESIVVFESYDLNSALRAQGGSWERREFSLFEKPNNALVLAAYGGKELAFRLGYQKHRFAEETIDRMLGHLRTLLEGMVAHPTQRLCDLPLLTGFERHQLLTQWNETETPYPRESCIPQLFQDQVERTPGAVAIVWGDQQLTYLELNARSNQLAHYLRKWGVGPEVLVGLCVERSIDMMVGLVGIMKAGGAYVPLDPAYPADRLEFMLSDSRIPVVLTQTTLLGRLSGLGRGDARCLCLDRDWASVARESAINPPCEVKAENLAYVIYTSGTTGRPKGILVPHRGVIRLVLGVDYVELGPKSVLLQLAPISFDASTLEVWAPLLHGGTCALFAGAAPTSEQLRQAIQRHGVNVLWLTSSLYNAVIDEAPEVLRGIGQLLIGGEALSVTHVKRGLEWLPSPQLINGYGPTENTTFTCCYRIPKQIPAEWNSIPIGKPIANTRVYVLDPWMKPAPVGVWGELYVGGDGLGRGYLNQPALTAEQFIADPFSQKPGARLYRTGDVCRYLKDGNIAFGGRLDQQVKIRGFRIELGEIEAVLEQHPLVKKAVVNVRQIMTSEKQLIGYLVPQSGQSPSDGDLRQFLKKKLPEYMLPAVFVRIEAVPLTPNGKVDRKALPNPCQNEGAEGKPFATARTPVEVALARIWCEVLRLKEVGIHDNFFELGGHSLLATQVMSRISKVFQLELPFKELFETPTVAELAQAITSISAAKEQQASPSGTTVQGFEQGVI